MSIPELKEKLIDKIRQTENKELLEDLSNLIELDEPDAVYMLTEEQTLGVNEAKKQIASGEFLTNEEADKEIDQWLSE